MTTLIKFADQSPEATSQDTSGATISGTPEHTVWVHFKGAADSFRAGVEKHLYGPHERPFCAFVEVFRCGSGQLAFGCGDAVTYLDCQLAMAALCHADPAHGHPVA